VHVAKSQQVFKVTSLCLYTRNATMFATGFVGDALRNTVPSVNKLLLQFVNAVFRFCVMSGSVET